MEHLSHARCSGVSSVVREQFGSSLLSKTLGICQVLNKYMCVLISPGFEFRSSLQFLIDLKWNKNFLKTQRPSVCTCFKMIYSLKIKFEILISQINWSRIKFCLNCPTFRHWAPVSIAAHLVQALVTSLRPLEQPPGWSLCCSSVLYSSSTARAVFSEPKWNPLSLPYLIASTGFHVHLE